MAVEARMLHVRFEGRSVDVALSDLDVGDLSTDREVKGAIARFLDVAEQRFGHYAVDRHATGNLTVRPEAVFG